MYMRHLKKIIPLALSLTLCINPFVITNTYASSDGILPDIGTAGATTLSIGQEIEMGNFYVRQFRSSLSIIDDPVLSNYINTLGQKLVKMANYPQVTFHFYIVNDPEINAFAIFGGNIFVNTGLIAETDTESQLASVLAHEISHVTQRHLASRLENQRKTSPLSMAATIGSLLLAIANPEAGMAALSTTIAGTQQNMISFTQSNEQEADRLGIALLYKSGFDPKGMTQFMDKLADKARFMSKPPEMLLTHPLPESRLSDARDRVTHLPTTQITSSIDYYIAKIRTQFFTTSRSNKISTLLNTLAKGSSIEKEASIYGQAFQALQNKNPERANELISSLLPKYANTYWIDDITTDINIDRKQAATAIKQLQESMKTDNSSVLQINLANAYISNNEFKKAITLLHRYTYYYPNDPNGWTLLIDSYQKTNQSAPLMAARAELLALTGQFQQAISLLTSASKASPNNSTEQARIDARIDELRDLQLRYKKYIK